MGRWVKKLPDGTIKTESINRDECKYFINEECYNIKSELYGRFPVPVYHCQVCPYFEREVE